MRNFEGFITTYQEPLDYDPQEIVHLENKIEQRPEPGQEGVLALLSGEKMSIEPSGFEEVRARGGEEHRLRSGESSHKWQPLGVGSIDSEENEPLSLSEPEIESETEKED